MTSLEIVGLVAIILISCFAIVAIIVAIPLLRLLNRAKLLVEKLNEGLEPIIEKLNLTVANLNSEVSSISDLTQSISSIVEQLEKVIRLARILVTDPIIKLISTTAGIVSGVKETSRKKGRGEDK